MSRMRRHNITGVVYHCISRFANQAWHMRDDDDRATFLHLFGAALEHTDWRCIAYVMMSNHIHYAMVAGRMPMESWTRRTHSPFANYLNRRYGHLGPVFASRVKDHGFMDAGAGRVIAYIHNNPVRAGVVRRAVESSWSSHRAYVGHVEAPKWLDVEGGLRRAGFTDRALFDAWVDATPGEREDSDLVTHRMETRRVGRIHGGVPVSDGDEVMVPLVARPFAHVRVDPSRVLYRVADIMALPVPRICSSQRAPQLSSARHCVVVAGIDLGIAKSDLAALLGISPAGVHKTSERASTDMERRVVELVVESMTIRLRAGFQVA